MKRALAAMVAGLFIASGFACSGGSPDGSGAGAATSASASEGSGGSIDVPEIRDADMLYRAAIAPSCASSEGACHSKRAYPELTTLKDFLTLAGAPCQLGAQDPKQTLDVCETRGDLLNIGGVDDEILDVVVADSEPYPPRQVTVRLANAPAGIDPASAFVHRDEDKRPLSQVAIAQTADPKALALDVTNDPMLASFFDVRAWDGDRVRAGDPNENGMAHASSTPWAEITPGDPTRSFFYKRLLGDKYGPEMPLITGTWDAAATRAVYCFVLGLPKGATSASIDPKAPIDYANCPLDPNAPDPNASGGWPAVRKLVGSRCATSGCHDSNAVSAGLDLTANAISFKKHVIDVPSSQVSSALRIVPGQPAASYLLCKVKSDCDAKAMGTKTMPLTGAPLSKEEIKTISDWIVNGAVVE